MLLFVLGYSAILPEQHASGIETWPDSSRNPQERRCSTSCLLHLGGKSDDFSHFETSQRKVSWTFHICHIYNYIYIYLYKNFFLFLKKTDRGGSQTSTFFNCSKGPILGSKRFQFRQVGVFGSHGEGHQAFACPEGIGSTIPGMHGCSFSKIHATAIDP